MNGNKSAVARRGAVLEANKQEQINVTFLQVQGSLQKALIEWVEFLELSDSFLFVSDSFRGKEQIDASAWFIYFPARKNFRQNSS